MASNKKYGRKKTGEVAQHFARRVKELREQKGWTQLQLAQKLGVTRTAAANYEQGISIPSLPGLVKLAQMFGVTLDALVCGSDAPEHVIQDRELLTFFRRLDRLHFHTKAVLMEVFEAVLLKEEQRTRGSSHVGSNSAA